MKVTTDLTLDELRAVVRKLSEELGILDEYTYYALLEKGERRRPLEEVRFHSKALETYVSELVNAIRGILEKWHQILQNTLTS